MRKKMEAVDALLYSVSKHIAVQFGLRHQYEVDRHIRKLCSSHRPKLGLVVRDQEIFLPMPTIVPQVGWWGPEAPLISQSNNFEASKRKSD